MPANCEGIRGGSAVEKVFSRIGRVTEQVVSQGVIESVTEINGVRNAIVPHKLM